MERCSHENTIKEYRVVCEDCGVLIMPDILDRMKNIMDYLRMNLVKYDKLEKDINNINNSIEILTKYLTNKDL